MTRYLIDKNVFVDAYRQNYRPAQFMGVWDWYMLAANAGVVASVRRVQEELRGSDVHEWLRPILPSDFFKDPTQDSLNHFARIEEWLKSNAAYSDRAVRKFMRGADPQLISIGLAEGISVVTLEAKEPPDKKDTAVKIPDVCDEFGVEVVRPHKMFADEGVKFVLHPEFGIPARLG